MIITFYIESLIREYNKEMKTRDRLILGKGHYIEYFPISLSKDTMDMIFEYIKLQ